MEYMRIEGFLGGAISKLINKGIKNKTGYTSGVTLNSFNLKAVDGMVVVNTEIVMSQDDFNKIMEEVIR